MAKEKEVVLLAGGDVKIYPDYENPDSIFANVAETMREADIAFCQNEAVYSTRATPHHPRVSTLSHPRCVPALKFAGIDIISCASNHTMDGGADALFDTLELFRQNGVTPVGAGRNIAEARAPVILERKGTKIGFLAYNSILPHDYAATATTPGCAPIRVYTHYEHVLFEQPGTQPKIVTFAYPEDVEAMVEDINKLRPLVDVLVVSMHWGVHFTRAVLAMYQLAVGHIALDAGADIILGHHPHILKPVEVYKGKVIFHSLAHFAMDSRRGPKEQWSPGFKLLAKMHRLEFTTDPAWSRYSFPPEYRKTMVAKVVIADKKIKRVSFLPAMINGKAQPNILTRQDRDFGDVVNYVKDITADQELATKLTVEGDEVVVST